MAKSVPSHATPEMLKWARVKAGLTIQDVASSEDIEPETISNWESGTGTPSLAVLRRLGDRYKRPLQVFYLPSPQQTFNIIKDFRRLAVGEPLEYSSQLRLAIRQCQERQQWTSAQVQEIGVRKLTFLNSATTGSSIASLARRTRRLLGVTIEQQLAAKDVRQSLWLWRRAIEDAGVFVWQVTGVPVEEMRGFTLADPFAPVIVLNSADSVSARLFSLLHEFGHLWLGESGVSCMDVEAILSNSQLEVERFCNRLAAETLIPAADFSAQVPKDWQERVDDVLYTLSSRYGVSPAVIVLRLVELKFADRQFAEKKLVELRGYLKKSSGPVRQSVKVVSNNGEAFVRLAIAAYDEGEIHGGQLTRLLGMKLKHLQEVTRRLYPGRVPLLGQEK